MVSSYLVHSIQFGTPAVRREGTGFLTASAKDYGEGRRNIHKLMRVFLGGYWRTQMFQITMNGEGNGGVRHAGQAFCTWSLSWGLLDVFLMIRLGM